MSSIVKRILYVGGFELPDKNAAALRVLGNAKALRVLGYEVVFLDMSRDVQNTRLSEPHYSEGFITYTQKHPISLRELFRYWLFPIHIEEVLAKHSDWYAVIAYNYPAISLYRLIEICRKYGLKIYGDCTEWHTLGKLNLKFLLLQVDMFLRMSCIQKKVDGVIVISHLIERHFAKHIKTVVLPPLVDSHDDKWQHKESHFQTGTNLVYFGSPGPDKDKLDIIIKLLSRVSDDIRLRIIGITLSQFKNIYPNYNMLLKSLLDNERLIFMGHLSHKDSLAVVKKSDYSIFYRHHTRTAMAGFPTKFVESISCGIPVITSDTSDIQEYAKGKNAIIIKCDVFSKELGNLLNKISNKEIKVPSVDKSTFDFRRFVPNLKIFMEE